MTMSFDEAIPFLPWTIVIYLGCFLFWVVNYYICAIQDKDRRNQFFCADAIAKGICLILFLLIPTTNIRPEIVDYDIWGILMKFLYRIDNADNLFPSIHCLVSWLCWIGVKNRKELPAWYRYFSLMAAIAVCISTLTTRQHVIVDVIAGVSLAEISYYISGFPKVREVYASVILFIQHVLSKKGE